MENKKVVVTGGAGFIGSNLAHKLAANNTLTIIDNLSTGNQENISDLIDRQNVTFIRGNILDQQLLEKTFNNIDYVFHLAAIPSVPRSIEDPSSTNAVNITGTLNVLLAAKNTKVKKVVFSSSSSVYGDTPTLPKREDMPPNPQSPYALTKLTGEYYCQIFHRIYGLPTICLRYFNVYGPRQNPKSEYAAVIPSFISLVSHDKSPVIFGNGTQTRDFTFVKDVVQANILAAEADATGVFNIGSGNNISINELADTIVKRLGRNIQPAYEKPRNGDISDSLADISKARAIGYEPEYSLEWGLSQTIHSLQS